LQKFSKYSLFILKKTTLFVLLFVFLGQAFASGFVNIAAHSAKDKIIKATPEKTTFSQWFYFENIEEDVDSEDDSDDDNPSHFFVSIPAQFFFGCITNIAKSNCHSQVFFSYSKSRRYILFHSLKLDC
jgi:hypothetical protein